MYNMRLIDANELMEWLRGKIRECVFLNAHAEAAITEEIMRYVKHMPAIPAIPVECMIDRATDPERAPLYRRYAQMLLEEWQQEQEART